MPLAMICLRSRLDHAGLLKPQRVKPDRVFGIVLPPLVVRHVGHRLQGIVIVGRETVIDDLSRHALRLGDTKVRRFENGADDALGRDRVVLNEVGVAGQHAAKVLRPRTIDGAVDDYVTDVSGPQFLRLRRKAEKRIDLAFGEERHWFDIWASDPVDVP